MEGKMGDGRVAEFNKTVKNGCIAVPKDKWNEQDKCDLFLYRNLTLSK